MNQKTARLLTKWATANKKNPRHVRRWWVTLTRAERTVERVRIEKELE